MRLIKLVFLLMFTLLLCACCVSSHQQEKNKDLPPTEDVQKSREESNQQSKHDEVISTEINESVFHSVADWKDEESIFYITNTANGSTIHSYNIYTGDSSIFFRSEAPIVQFEANSNHSLFLVHTSPTTYEANLIILDEKGEIQYNTKIQSFELEFTWNQLNHEELFVSSFNEDWTYNTYIINTTEKSITDNPVKIPFMQWVGDTKISYLKWNQDVPTLTAPMYIYDRKMKEESLFANNVLTNTNYSNVMTTVEVFDDKGNASIKFYELSTMKLINELPTRVVSLYSDWSIPYQDYNKDKQVFYLLEVNEENTSYSLISYNIETKEKKVLIEGLENYQFKLSPNGDYALYGPRFEYMIDLKNKKLVDLITFK